MSAQIIPFPTERMAEQPLSKRRLAIAIGRSPRWIEMEMRKGLPYERKPNGETRFRLGEVFDWMDRRNG